MVQSMREVPEECDVLVDTPLGKVKNYKIFKCRVKPNLTHLTVEKRPHKCQLDNQQAKGNGKLEPNAAHTTMTDILLNF